MKLIISYQTGKTEILSISNIDNIEFGVDVLTIIVLVGVSFSIKYCNIKSIVIA